MKKVLIVSQPSRISNFFTEPIKHNLKQLRGMGYAIHFTKSLIPDLWDSDILGLDSKYLLDLNLPQDELFEVITRSRQHASKVIWFDNSDGTGTNYFEILPHVDLYLKKQLMKDMNTYAEQWYGDRPFTDFYHKQNGIMDNQVRMSKPLIPDQAHKVNLSWHIGIGDMETDIDSTWLRYLKHKLLPLRKNYFHNPKSTKSWDIMFRGSRAYTRETIEYQRQRIGRIYDSLTHLNKAPNGWVSPKQYKNEARQSKLVLSPFGWGEIGVRDFEAWIYGACLIKPDMSHLLTWPNLFVPNKTYVPIHWDMGDFQAVVQNLLDDQDLRVKIATQGQNAYRHTLSPKGQNEFCKWFIQQIEM